jgi:glycosyltransferase involved in cell wall biosynthesis
MPDVSVVIPTWNRAELLVKAVRSALAQTIPPLEVLVCDDGSTDDSEKVVSTMGDTRVRWLAGERGGRPAIPRNRGVRESKGEWIAFLDNDDEWLPDKLEKQLRLAERTGCRAVCSNASRNVPGQGVMGNYLTWDCERITFDDLLRVNQVICSSALVHRSLFEKMMGFPENEVLKALEDYALWLRLATLTDFAFSAEPLLVYHDDTANSIRREGVDVWQQRGAVFADFLAWGERENIDKLWLRKVLNRLQMDKVDKVFVTIQKMKKMLLP